MAELVVNAISESGGSPTGVTLSSNQNNTYATAQAGTGATGGTPFGIEVGQASGTPFLIYRNGLSFDTSSLGSGATITAAVLALYGWSDYSDTDFGLTIVSGADLANLLVDADFQELLNDTTSFGSINTSSFVEGGWNNITLNASGIADINKTGTTRFGLRSSRDISATAPTGLESIQYETPWIDGWAATHRPKLTITYTLAFIPKIFII